MKGTKKEDPKDKDPFDFPPSRVFPTLGPEIDSDKRRYVRRGRHPTRREVDEVMCRLKGDEALLAELEEAYADLDELSHLIALTRCVKNALIDGKERRRKTKRVRKDKERKYDMAQERQQKLSHKKPRRDSKMATEPSSKAEFRRVIPAELFAREELRLLKKRQGNYRDHFLLRACNLLKRTDKPNRLLAALVNRFDFHGKNPCPRCSKYNKEKGRCTLDNIFECPRHEKERKAVFESLHR
jgi:hypothetical protein